MMITLVCLLVIINSLEFTAFAASQEVFELSIIHFNDFHARFQETDEAGEPCQSENNCIGGFSRLHHEITRLKNETPDSIVLDAGDSFQGTIWYTVGKWNVTQEFMNTLPIDASTLGNHEFDDGTEGVVPYIKALNHPVVVCNINDTLEPLIQNTFNKSVVITRNGRKIGIIGVITTTTKESELENLIFEDESSSVNKEADRLVEEEGVFTVIVLSHCGYNVDQQIAANASEKISIIVGGHSHTFLYSGDNPPGPETPQGPYPTTVTSKYGHTVLIVQASAFSRYVGYITIGLDPNGEVANYSGNPIFLSSTVPQDENINQMLIPWEERIDQLDNIPIGNTLVTLSNQGCYNRECTIGNIVTDAFVFYYTANPPEGTWTSAPIGIINAGGLHQTIEAGNITYADLLAVLPFQDDVNLGSIKGQYLKEMFESTIVANYTGEGLPSLILLQVSGIKLRYDLNKPSGQQIESIQVRCQNCTIPKYEPLDLEKYYRIAIPSFLAMGGDGLTMLGNIEIISRGPIDIETLEYYIERRNPVYVEEEGRILISGDFIIPS